MKTNTSIGFSGISLLSLGLAITYIQGQNVPASLFLIVLGSLLTIVYFALDIKNVFSFLASKGFRYGSNSILMSIIFLAILVFLQVIVSHKKVQFDITSDKKFTLSEQTVKILDNLKQKIQLVAFVDKNNVAAKDLFEQYKALTSNISYEVIDPNINPSRAKQYQVRELNTVVVVNGVKEEKINQINEEKLTNALIKVTKEGQKKIYFVQGHGEKLFSDFDKTGVSTLKGELEKQNYSIANLILLQVKEIPSDAAVVIMAGIQKGLMPEEEKMLKAYLEKGGRVLAMVEPDSTAQAKAFFTNYNITVRNDVIVDKLSRAFGGDFLVPMVPNYNPHEITKSLRAATFYPMASSLDLSKSGTNEITVEALANTTENSWGETNKELLKQNRAGLEPEDTRGPLTIAALAKIKVKHNTEKDKKEEDKKEKSGYLLAFSDSDFVSNGSLMLSGNSDFALNSINWLAQEEDLIAIRPKDHKSTPMVLTEVQGRLLFWSNLIFLPLTVIILGTLIVGKRRLRAV